jgi:hypothetical protein
MMRREGFGGLVVAGAVVVASAQAAMVPADFQGRWAGSRAQCGVHHEASLTVHEERVDFYESRGSVLSVTVARPLEIELELELTGEGQTWRAVTRFVLSKDKRTLTDVTNSRSPFARVRCDGEAEGEAAG